MNYRPTGGCGSETQSHTIDMNHNFLGIYALNEILRKAFLSLQHSRKLEITKG
jgi:hypothetical protein